MNDATHLPERTIDVQDTHSRPAQADRPIPDLLRDLTAEVKTLVRDELELVRIEMTRKGKMAGESAGLFGATTIFGLGAFLALTTTIIAIIALALPVWGAALIVTIAYGAIALVSALIGKSKLKAVVAIPSSSAESVRGDVEAARIGVARGR